MSQPKSVRALKPNVSRDEALRHFTAGAPNFAANLTRGPVRSIADLYIPYRIFRVAITSAGHEQSQAFALDSVHGTLDLFEFPSLPPAHDLVSVTTRNALPISLDIQ
jgi:hypothetical protein